MPSAHSALSSVTQRKPRAQINPVCSQQKHDPKNEGLRSVQACRGTESPCGRPHGEGTGSDQGMSEWRGCVRRRGSRRGEGSDRQACSPAWALYSMSTAPTAGSIHVELKWARPSGGVQVKYGATSTLGFSKHLLLLHPCAPQVSYLSRP